LLKLLENALLIVRSNAHPCIPHSDLHHSVRPGGCDAHFAAIWGKLHSVGEEIEEDLLHLPLISCQGINVVRNFQRQCDTVCQGTLLDHHQTALQKLSEIERAQLQLQPPGLDLGEIQNVVD
jgi:hypothetical protein